MASIEARLPVVKLTQENYIPWKFHIGLMLENLEADKIASGSKPRPTNQPDWK